MATDYTGTNNKAKKKRRNYMKRWKRQTTKETISDRTILAFGKYYGIRVVEVRKSDPGYYQWLCETFTIEQ